MKEIRVNLSQNSETCSYDVYITAKMFNGAPIANTGNVDVSAGLGKLSSTINDILTTLEDFEEQRHREWEKKMMEEYYNFQGNVVNARSYF
jgi:hypothetical protein